MRPFLGTFILLGILSFLISCNNGNNSEKKDKSTTKQEKIDSSAIKKSKADSISKAKKEKKVNYNQIGFKLMKSESLSGLRLDLSSKKVSEIIGEPEEKTDPALWGADGLYHQSWTYTEKGISLDIVGKEGERQTLSRITITEPCTFKTKRKIGIGSRVDEVRTAYQEEIDPASSSASSIAAGTHYGGVIFGIENKKVNQIFIGIAAE
ncbi:MAG: hypothetical protein HXX09_09605 [Bacteroidetes bacterium]|nr:hypothetical protein [Bacteroidota bacterium]